MRQADVLRHLDALIAETGDDSFADRLRKLRQRVEHTDEPSITEIYSTVFPGSKPGSQRVQFSALRKQIETEATAAGRRFALIKPDLRGKDVGEIRCRFEGTPIQNLDAEQRFTDEAVSQLDRMDLVDPEIYATTGRELQAKATGTGKPKPLVRFFVSYAHADAALFHRLIDPLEKDLKLSKDYRFEVWTDRHIPLGADWFESIGSAIDQCDFGLLMVSREFLNSTFIIEEEVKALVGRGKPLIPVALGSVNLDRETKGLAKQQFYLLEETGKAPRSFSECTAPTVKDRFIDGMVQRIEERIDVVTSDASKAAPRKAERGQRHDLRQFADATWIDASFPDAEIDPEAAAGMRLDEFGRRVTKATANEDPFAGLRTKAVDYLIDWFEDPTEPPVAAVLGEIGSGKTTMLMILARALGQRRQRDPDLPPVIFVDLRNYQREEEGLLENILADLIRRHWAGDAGHELTPADIIRCVQEDGGLIIFDGLDEKIIPLSEQRRVAFIHELWRVLPPQVVDRAAGRKGRGKMIISCRSHYFPTVIAQNDAFTVGGRIGVKQKDYAACVMLPWRKEQIDEYLAKVVGADKVAAAQEIIASVHNLSDLAPRPYLLSLIAPHLSELELKRAAGEKVNGASLYQIFVEQWLARDAGKHLFTPEHKLEMMGTLAWHLHSKNLRELPWAKVAEWLDNFLYEHPAIAARYQREAVSAEMLNQDFRTATFFLRPDDEKENFRFAHTSLLEYFLACHLVRPLEDRQQTATVWNIPLPSDETLDFIGQLLNLVDDPNLSHLTGILDDERASDMARRAALRYWMVATERGWVAPNPRAPQLINLDLGAWDLRSVDLRTASFIGSNLRRSKVVDCNLNDARAQPVYASPREFNATTKAHLAPLPRSCSAEMDFGGSNDIGCNAAVVDGLSEANGQSRLMHRNSTLGTNVAARLGHTCRVNACSFSPDGSLLASASDDRIVRIWDAGSGAPLLALEGHTNWVSACAFSPDGARLASASNDKTLRVWDTASGEAMLVLEGHSGVVNACAFSPDGARLASASADQTVLTWDATSGARLLELRGHRARVNACTFSPDGTRIASASADGTVRIWGAASGKLLLVLEGHAAGVNACAFSPDGARVASASTDRTVRIWNTASGKLLLALGWHSAALKACAFSLDGARLATASDDWILRLWDASTGELLRTWAGASYGECSFVDFGNNKIIGVPQKAPFTNPDDGSLLAGTTTYNPQAL